MRNRPAILFCLNFLFLSCGPTPVVEEKTDNPAPLPVIERIARYDVAHLELTADYLMLPYQKMTPAHVLQLAAIYCDSLLMAQTLADGVNPNTIFGGNHLLPEAVACSGNGLVLAKLLIEAGADVNGSDEWNDNALSFAIGEGDITLVGYLLDNGADLNQRDTDENYGCKPIYRANTPEMLEFLMSRGASLDSVCTSGQTLLHFAAEVDSANFIRYLLEHDLVDPAATDAYGETAYNYATANASSQAQTLLRAE